VAEKTQPPAFQVMKSGLRVVSPRYITGDLQFLMVNYIIGQYNFITFSLNYPEYYKSLNTMVQSLFDEVAADGYRLVEGQTTEQGKLLPSIYEVPIQWNNIKNYGYLTSAVRTALDAVADTPTDDTFGNNSIINLGDTLLDESAEGITAKLDGPVNTWMFQSPNHPSERVDFRTVNEARRTTFGLTEDQIKYTDIFNPNVPEQRYPEFQDGNLKATIELESHNGMEFTLDTDNYMKETENSVLSTVYPDLRGYGRGSFDVTADELPLNVESQFNTLEYTTAYSIFKTGVYYRVMRYTIDVSWKEKEADAKDGIHGGAIKQLYDILLGTSDYEGAIITTKIRDDLDRAKSPIIPVSATITGLTTDGKSLSIHPSNMFITYTESTATEIHIGADTKDFQVQLLVVVEEQQDMGMATNSILRVRLTPLEQTRDLLRYCDLYGSQLVNSSFWDINGTTINARNTEWKAILEKIIDTKPTLGRILVKDKVNPTQRIFAITGCSSSRADDLIEFKGETIGDETDTLSPLDAKSPSPETMEDKIRKVVGRIQGDVDTLWKLELDSVAKLVTDYIIDPTLEEDGRNPKGMGTLNVVIDSEHAIIAEVQKWLACKSALDSLTLSGDISHEVKQLFYPNITIINKQREDTNKIAYTTDEYNTIVDALQITKAMLKTKMDDIIVLIKGIQNTLDITMGGGGQLVQTLKTIEAFPKTETAKSQLKSLDLSDSVISDLSKRLNEMKIRIDDEVLKPARKFSLAVTEFTFSTSALSGPNPEATYQEKYDMLIQLLEPFPVKHIDNWIYNDYLNMGDDSKMKGDVHGIKHDLLYAIIKKETLNDSDLTASVYRKLRQTLAGDTAVEDSKFVITDKWLTDGTAGDIIALSDDYPLCRQCMRLDESSFETAEPVVDRGWFMDMGIIANTDSISNNAMNPIHRNQIFGIIRAWKASDSNPNVAIPGADAESLARNLHTHTKTGITLRSDESAVFPMLPLSSMLFGERQKWIDANNQAETKIYPLVPDTLVPDRAGFDKWLNRLYGQEVKTAWHRISSSEEATLSALDDKEVVFINPSREVKYILEGGSENTISIASRQFLCLIRIPDHRPEGSAPVLRFLVFPLENKIAESDIDDLEKLRFSPTLDYFDPKYGDRNELVNKITFSTFSLTSTHESQMVFRPHYNRIENAQCTYALEELSDAETQLPQQEPEKQTAELIITDYWILSYTALRAISDKFMPPYKFVSQPLIDFSDESYISVNVIAPSPLWRDTFIPVTRKESTTDIADQSITQNLATMSNLAQTSTGAPQATWDGTLFSFDEIDDPDSSETNITSPSHMYTVVTKDEKGFSFLQTLVNNNPLIIPKKVSGDPYVPPAVGSIDAWNGNTTKFEIEMKSSDTSKYDPGGDIMLFVDSKYASYLDNLPSIISNGKCTIRMDFNHMVVQIDTQHDTLTMLQTTRIILAKLLLGIMKDKLDSIIDEGHTGLTLSYFVTDAPDTEQQWIDITVQMERI